MRPTGPLTEQTCHALRQQLATAFASGVQSIAVDLSAVSDVDAAGLQVLAGAAKHLKRRHGLLVVTKAPEHIVAMLKVNELSQLLDLTASPGLRVVAGDGEAFPSDPTQQLGSRRLRVVRPGSA